MRVLVKIFKNLPTTVILGFLTIFYGAIFINAQSILRSASENLPLFLGHGIFIIFSIIPIGIKGGLVFYRGKKRAVLKRIIYYSALILIILGYLLYFNTDLSEMWNSFIKGGFLKEFHRPIFGFISIGTVYLFYFLLMGIVKVENFVESVKNMKMVSPIFCFGLPVFWKESLLELNLSNDHISFLNFLSIISGLMFLTAALTYYVAKHYNLDRDPLNFKNLPRNKRKIYQISLGFFFFGLSLLLFMTIDLSYLVTTSSL